MVWRGELALIAGVVAPIGAVGAVACFQGSKKAGLGGETTLLLCYVPMMIALAPIGPPIAHFFRGSVWRGVVSASLYASLSLGTAAVFAHKPITSRHDNDGRWLSASIGFGAGALTASLIDALALSWYSEAARSPNTPGTGPWLSVQGDSVAGGLRGSF